MNIRAIALFFTLAVAGCSQLSYLGENYGQVKSERFGYSGKTWLIYDRPTDDRLMISPNFGDELASSVIEGLTLGLSGKVNGPEGAYHAAAAAYLRSKESPCQVTNGAHIFENSWEFFYTC